MSYQVLQGIKITPKGSRNIERFGKSFNGESWPNSFAFNGWIYSSSVDIGYSNAPTEIKISIVLEAKDRAQISTVFDINKDDLRCDAGEGGDENLYDINFNGIVFTDFILYSYDLNIENQNKILTVVFKDYSVILDKIYVGLIKRQGNKFIRSSISLVEFPVNCTDCALNGDNFTSLGAVFRDINYGSYVGINGKTYDNFDGIVGIGNVYKQWNNLFTAPVSSNKFDLNGGFLIIGTEGISEEKCGNLAEIFYNFNQLLASLRIRGLNFIGEFPRTSTDSDFIYKQNYMGTLREVLQQWCADLGYDFYCKGKSFVGLNLNRPFDITNITQITDPTTSLGGEFALNSNATIVSYKENNTIANSYKQSIITTNIRPRETKTHSKSPKRYVGLLPLHPIDFNTPSLTLINRKDIFGNSFADNSLTNSFIPGSSDLNKTLYQLDNRTFRDVDASIALSHYDGDLRDIYCQEKAIYSSTSGDSAANFMALGMFPLIEITGVQDKATAIEAVLPQGDEVSNICIDSRFYKVYIGYYYPKLKEDIVTWEQNAAQAMYQYGAVVQGMIHGIPYVPNDILQDASPFAGLYGAFGRSITRITHSYEPSTEQYFDLYQAPFKDIILYSGLKNVANYLSPNIRIGQISNDWGTTQEEFKRSLSSKLDDACFNEYSNDASYTDIKDNKFKKYQDWKLNLFTPKSISDIEKYFDDYNGEFAKLSGQGQIDRIVKKYYDVNYKESNTCAKLHILVLTDTKNHPNIKIDFTSRGRDFINSVVLQKYLQNEKDAIKRIAYTKTPSDCDKTLLQEMCDGILNAKATFAPHDIRYNCALQDPYNAFEEGFNAGYLASPNSRALSINITKNPISSTDTVKLQNLFNSSDANGNIYYIDAIDNFLKYDQQQASLNIIYPISVESTDDIYYKGILTSSVEVENRSPEIVEIFGEPSNTNKNICAGVKVINNNSDSDLSPQLDPYTSRFLSYLTVITGDAQIITTVSGYHNLIKKINNYEISGASKSIELTLAGTPDFFGAFSTYIDPAYGLNKLSISAGDGGVVTSLSYADRPKTLPKPESILNKISPRII